jgi:hypothetical protein
MSESGQGRPDSFASTLKVQRSAVGSGSGRHETAPPMSQLGRLRTSPPSACRRVLRVQRMCASGGCSAAAAPATFRRADRGSDQDGDGFVAPDRGAARPLSRRRREYDRPRTGSRRSRCAPWRRSGGRWRPPASRQHLRQRLHLAAGGTGDGGEVHTRRDPANATCSTALAETRQGGNRRAGLRPSFLCAARPSKALTIGNFVT